MVENDGAIYPLIKVVPLEKENPLPTSKDMMKLLQIVPRITHAVVNEELSGLTAESTSALLPGTNPVRLGVQDEALWGKKFKIRLTSKRTSRKIDLNINFTTEHIRNDEADCGSETAKVIASISETGLETLETTVTSSTDDADASTKLLGTAASTTYADYTGS